MTDSEIQNTFVIPGSGSGSDTLKRFVIYTWFPFAVGFTVTYPLKRYQSILQLKDTMQDLQEEKKIQSNEEKHQQIDIDFNNYTNPRLLGYGSWPELFRGNMYDIIRYFPFGILQVVFKDKIQSLSIFSSSSDSYLIASVKQSLPLGLATVLTSAFLYSFDNEINYYRVGLRRGSKLINKPNIIDSYAGFSLFGLQTMVTSVMHGFLTAFVRKKMSLSPQSDMKHIFKEALDESKGDIDVSWWQLLAYSAMPFILHYSTYWMDTIRRRQMLTNESSTDAFRNLIEKNDRGKLSLWNGAGMEIIGRYATVVVTNLTVKFISKGIHKK